MSIHRKLTESGTTAAALSPAGLEQILRRPAARTEAANDALQIPPAGRLRFAFKRLFDIAVTLPVLVLALPVMAAVAAAVRLDSPGPVVFRQQRLGLNGKPFAILKFRTMTVAEDGAQVLQARRNDPRITRVGRVLRAWSLDELPQLFNVLKGEMSLVGPRPHARAHDEHYAALIGHYTLRQRVKPGITGWAQVNGLRGETPTLKTMRDRVDLDVWYARHAGIALDIEILFRTAFEVARRRNAF